MSFIYTPATASVPYTGAMKTDLTKYDSTVTISTALATASSSYKTPISIQLTTTTELLIFWGDSAIHAVVWDNFNRAFGTATLVRTVSGLSTYDVAASLISTLGTSASVLVCSLPNGNTNLETVVLSITNTTITVNTAVATTLANAGTFIQTPTVANAPQRLIPIGSSFVLCYYGTVAAVQTSFYTAITVSGTTPTLGTELQITNLGVFAYKQQSYVYSSSILLTVAVSTTTLWANPITVSGTTLTLGTPATKTTTGAYLLSAQFTDNRVAITYPNTNAFAGVVSVSGTVAAISSVDTGMSLGGTMNATMQIFGLKSIIVLNVTGTSNRVNVLTNTAGTASVGTSIDNPFGVNGNWGLAGSDSTNVYVQYPSTGNTYFLTISISGSNPLINLVYPSNSNVQINGTSNIFTLYDSNYGNFENSALLRTSSYKVSLLNTATNFLTYSFDGISIPQEQQAIGITGSSAYFNKSALNSAAGWLSYYNPANTTTDKKVFFRRIELT